jgi:hypothetical protein
MRARLRMLRLELRARGGPALRAPSLARSVLRSRALVLQAKPMWDSECDSLQLPQALVCCVYGQPGC